MHTTGPLFLTHFTKLFLCNTDIDVNRIMYLSATCDYYIWVESMDVTNDCQKQDSEEFIQVENITVPNNALQKYLKEIRLELKR